MLLIVLGRGMILCSRLWGWIARSSSGMGTLLVREGLIWLMAERIVTLDAHGGFVKGVTWDPVGNFLATQSDDKTVRIWDTDTWRCVETVSKPFEMSPQSTFFRRLRLVLTCALLIGSWSPDGAFIAASNAMNGPVFVAAVIEREGWAADISFVGHENTIQVAAFNPRLFSSKEDSEVGVKASCMLALGADDYTMSIWRNTVHKPLAVIRDIFSRQILDLCWSNDGLCLYGCSADGTIVTIAFRAAEFPELSPPELTQTILDDYHYQPKRRRAAPQKLLSTSTSFAAPPAGATEHVNIIVPRKGKPKERRRINLSGTMTGGSQQNGSAAGSGMSGGRPPLQRPVSPPPTRFGAADAFAAAADDDISFGSPSAATASMLRKARVAFDYDAESARAGDKRRASIEPDSGRAPKGRNMGSSRALGPVQEIRAPRVVIAGSGGGSGSSIMLPVPSIQSALRVQQEDGAGVFSAENGADDKPHYSVNFSQGGNYLWLDFLPSAVLAIVSTSKFCAAACEDGTVRIYTVSGRP